MIIVIPVEEKTTDGMICPSFGRTPYYLLFDSNNNTVRYIENNAAQASGGAGIKAAQLLVDSKVEAVITPRCGENAAEVLKDAGIEIYQTNGVSVKENMTLASNGDLAAMTSFHGGYHGVGGPR